ncbi:hypothetical protein Q4601_14370 [Shewanella sp. 1_MG-2023]|uniref:hypothetical protein n=1 Tax=unclassified Shewanella TaxID=196818 RepID=UPI0026E19469|nr:MULTISPECIES: hypothetical protein [unclassified Shewanella]MDO6611394.1 hypothetical protein [Shewanella sp. 7_MG-2023]MDO6771249.1 hypothetical protein [Shewanella sp. 2_MG-2023]MDO6795490.1 hypothetical protein [Shewanella sp. 1_MG-2023]
MRIFTLLQKAYLFEWLFSSIKAGIVALTLSLFFGLFHENWFFMPAFWGFWIPCLVFSAISSWKGRQALQPLSDVTATFSGNASEKQKKRAYEVLKDELDELESVDFDDEEELETKACAIENKAEMKRLLTALVNAGLIDLTSEVKEQVKEYIEDYDLLNDLLCKEHFVQEVLSHKSIIWQGGDIFEPDEYYAEMMETVASLATELEITNIHCKFDEDKKSVELTFDSSKGAQHWLFKQFTRSVSENFIIHLALMLKKEASLAMGLLDIIEDDEAAWAILLPKQSLYSLSQQGVLSGKEVVL